jgi:hypothetical protein
VRRPLEWGFLSNRDRYSTEMIVQTPRDPWRAAWQIAVSDQWMAVLLLSIAAGFVITAWLPQIPAGDHVVYARWLSEAQARFGDTISMMQALGLFTVTRSFGFRILLALLAGSLLLRLIESIEHLRRRRTTAESEEERRASWVALFPVWVYGGGLVLLSGLLITHLWGWREEGLIVQSGERVTLPHAAAWVVWDESTHTTTRSPGIVAWITEQVPGVQIRADDGTGKHLALQKNPNTEPVTQLTVALTEDPYFAIPDALLIARLALQPAVAPATAAPPVPVLVQIYRSPPGRLVAETIVEGKTRLSIDNVTLELVSVSYARLTVVFNPGLWPTGVGLALLVTGLLGSIVWPAHRRGPGDGTGAADA